MHLRDIGDADLTGAAGDAVAVRAAVLVAEGESGAAWGGRLWPYRPLALRSGGYTLWVRGEEAGSVVVHAVQAADGREAADFTGEGAPHPLLQRLVAQGRAPHTGRPPRFPRVAGEVEPTPLARFTGSLTAAVRALLTLPRRLRARRGWGSPTIQGAAPRGLSRRGR